MELDQKLDSNSKAEWVAPHDHPSRSCGGCTACCTLMNIPEFDNPAGTPCPKECSTGCSIHEIKPKTCKEYECAWLGSGLDEAFRPDKIRVMISMYNTPLGNCIVAQELDKDAFWKDAAKSFVAAVAKREDAFVLIFSGKDRQILFPEWKPRLKERYQRNPNIVDCLNIIGN